MSEKPKVRFVLALHNHQPVGNFGEVFAAAFDDSYDPFLEVAADFPELRFSLHTSGPLMEWLAENRPGYVERLRGMVAGGQVEILGGAFYEPILPMIPSRDRVGQIVGYSAYLHELLGADVRGMWLAERVWEQALVGDLADAGVEYLILDDHHFARAGLDADALHGSYMTEDQGRILRVWPGSEKVRYTVPFREPHETIDHLGRIYDSWPHWGAGGPVVVFGDDGEKFGSWPETNEHVYGSGPDDRGGWLRRFLELLKDNLHWIDVCTLAQATDATPPLGRVYLPTCSYREMTEWALPADRLERHQDAVERLDERGDAQTKRLLGGGDWRNFKVKYPETNAMYARMMQVSERLRRVCSGDPQRRSDARADAARTALYRGQCNCAYWHGSFGGLYLPHLRGEVYRQLILADNHLRELDSDDTELAAADFDFDGFDELRLPCGDSTLFLAPARGGTVTEWDYHPVPLNLAAGLTRRKEAYHRRIAAAAAGKGATASDGSVVKLKQADIGDSLHYDRYPRRSLVDLFLSPDATAADFRGQTVKLRTDFADVPYELELPGPDSEHPFVTLSREGPVWDVPLTVWKGIDTRSGEPGRCDFKYAIDKPDAAELTFAVEFNFAGLATGEGRFLTLDGGTPHGLDEEFDGAGETLTLRDEWLGVQVALWDLDGPGLNCWVQPVRTVSGSEGGIELVHQSVSVALWWKLEAGAEQSRRHFGVRVSRI